MKKSPRQTLTAPIRRVRFVWVAAFFCFWACAIVLRLSWLQIVRHGDFAHRAAMQQQRTFEVSPRRGVLYDRNLRELAMTVKVDSVYAVPSELGEHKAEVAAMLARVVHTDELDHYTTEQAILNRLTTGKSFAWVARKLDKETAQRVRELSQTVKGIYLTDEDKRFYPNGDLAAQVLGYVGTEDKGLGGLEINFEDQLHGTPGHRLTAVDAKRHALSSDEQQPMSGENLVLSIDANVQYIAERALDAQVEKMHAKHGTVVVQDPHTGQILALAVSPRFNPNDARHIDGDSLANLAVSDVYEPGSTFKLVSYSAALDAGGVEPTDIVDCQGGAYTLFGRTMHDDKSDHFGRVTVQFALEHSSDVGAVKMVQKVGNEKFYEYMKGFGFGERSGIELPSETRGLLRGPKKWGATSFMSMAIGQEVGVTPVQLVTMVSTIANGGVYMPPHILLQSTDEMKGDPRLKPSAFHPSYQLPTTLPDGSHRVIREITAAKMRMMMQGIVTEGTGSLARLNGYSSAGKTGTAQKIDPDTHTYSHTKLVASFAGFAPVSSPAIAVAVVIDTPTVGTGYGGTTSAPVFADVAQQVLEYLGVPHDQPLKTKQQMQTPPPQHIAADDRPDENAGDMNAMFAEINNLPADDPLRHPNSATPIASTEVADDPAKKTSQVAANKSAASGLKSLLPAKVLETFHKAGNTTSVMPDAVNEARVEAPRIQPQVQKRANGAVIVDPAKRVAVPEFHGDGLRSVVQQASAAGLSVQPLGSGLAREQVPAAGTMVPIGTEIVVRFSR